MFVPLQSSHQLRVLCHVFFFLFQNTQDKRIATFVSPFLLINLFLRVREECREVKKCNLHNKCLCMYECVSMCVIYVGVNIYVGGIYANKFIDRNNSQKKFLLCGLLTWVFGQVFYLPYVDLCMAWVPEWESFPRCGVNERKRCVCSRVCLQCTSEYLSK